MYIVTRCHYFIWYAKSGEAWFYFRDDFFTGDVLELAVFEVFRRVICKNEVILIKTMKRISC